MILPRCSALPLEFIPSRPRRSTTEFSVSFLPSTTLSSLSILSDHILSWVQAHNFILPLIFERLPRMLHCRFKSRDSPVQTVGQFGTSTSFTDLFKTPSKWSAKRSSLMSESPGNAITSLAVLFAAKAHNVLCGVVFLTILASRFYHLRWTTSRSRSTFIVSESSIVVVQGTATLAVAISVPSLFFEHNAANFSAASNVQQTPQPLTQARSPATC